MPKERVITFKQTPQDTDLYIVVRLVNCVEPTVNSLATKREVAQFARDRRTKVIVLPPGA